jgi:glycosyltransferase involved in cell wall biosynthesis
MRIFILADPNSIHAKRWISSLADNGIQLFLFGFNVPNDNYYEKIKNLTVYAANYSFTNERTSFKKLKYLFILNIVRKKIDEFQPDILHAHYATSYGLLGALTRFHPFIISVWGSDVYDFPNISILHRKLLCYNLKKADYILSTSNIMAAEISKYTNKPIKVTPFGVDLSLFRKLDINKHNDEYLVGTVKALAELYGIDTLIRSFKIVLDRNKELNLKLQIIGDGPDKIKLQSLAYNLGIGDKVGFLGKIENVRLPEYYNRFFVFVALSNSESFGVVAIESMACECPVVVSDADGFTEVVENMRTGFIVPKRDINATANAIQQFIDDKSLHDIMGKNGRIRVEQLYNWDHNVKHMISVYNSIISRSSNS